MTTKFVSIQSAINKALNSGLTFNGTKRSFTMNLKGKLIDLGVAKEEAAKTASEVSAFVAEKHGGEPFTIKVAQNIVKGSTEYGLFEHIDEDNAKPGKAKSSEHVAKKSIKKHAKQAKAKEEKKVVLTAEQSHIITAAKNKTMTLNDAISILLVTGTSQTTIADQLSLQFQRVKNVKKALMKKGEPKECFNEEQKAIFKTWLKEENRLKAERTTPKK